jgi:sulfhydrogenase subunit beta (sulfur reductase)
MRKGIRKSRIPDAVSLLARKRTVIAPVRKASSHVFAPASDPSLVDLGYQTTILPLKKFFMAPTEILLRYDARDQSCAVPSQPIEPRLFFGIHNYDLEALKRLDRAFSDGVRDETWLSRRGNCLFVGVSYTPDDHHFCESVGVPAESRDGFDVFLSDRGDLYGVEALTDAGAGIVEEISSLLEPCGTAREPMVHFRHKLRMSVAGIREAFPGAYSSPAWTEAARRCHSCGTCTIVCPTCYCFDVDDQTDLGATTGSRVRRWDSCQFPSFAAVAGGESFRDKRHDRVRHRMARKFTVIAGEKGQPSCVGCGRCIRQCTAGIDIVDVINAMA